MWWLIIWIIALLAFVAAGTMGFLPVWGYVVGVIVLGGITFLMIWFWLAPRNHFFTFVQESTAKIVVRGDAFSKALIQW